MKSVLFTLYVILTTPFVLLGNGVLWTMGYEVTNDSKGVAERIVENKGDPEECYDIRFFTNVMGPPVESVRSHCIYEYASLAQDPTACELLLPSAYGWSCFGGISGPLFREEPCDYKHISNEIYCNRFYSEDVLSVENVQLDNCSQYPRTDVREVCYWERTKQLNGIYECDLLEHPVMKDHCNFDYAVKEKDTSLCSAIKTEDRREYCKFYVEMKLKYAQ